MCSDVFNSVLLLREREEIAALDRSTVPSRPLQNVGHVGRIVASGGRESAILGGLGSGLV